MPEPTRRTQRYGVLRPVSRRDRSVARSHGVLRYRRRYRGYYAVAEDNVLDREEFLLRGSFQRMSRNAESERARPIAPECPPFREEPLSVPLCLRKRLRLRKAQQSAACVPANRFVSRGRKASVKAVIILRDDAVGLAPEHGVHAFQCFGDRIRVIVTTFNDIDGSPEGLREFSMISHDDAQDVVPSSTKSRNTRLPIFPVGVVMRSLITPRLSSSLSQVLDKFDPAPVSGTGSIDSRTSLDS